MFLTLKYSLCFATALLAAQVQGSELSSEVPSLEKQIRSDMHALIDSYDLSSLINEKEQADFNRGVDESTKKDVSLEELLAQLVSNLGSNPEKLFG